MTDRRTVRDSTTSDGVYIPSPHSSRTSSTRRGFRRPRPSPARRRPPARAPRRRRRRRQRTTARTRVGDISRRNSTMASSRVALGARVARRESSLGRRSHERRCRWTAHGRTTGDGRRTRAGEELETHSRGHAILVGLISIDNARDERRAEARGVAFGRSRVAMMRDARVWGGARARDGTGWDGMGRVKTCERDGRLIAVCCESYRRARRAMRFRIRLRCRRDRAGSRKRKGS